MEVMTASSKITAIIVVYNKELDESSVCLRIKKFADVIVIDNSTKKNKNELFCKDHDISYISMMGNKGLSRAYNAAIDEIVDTDAIVIVDDDTDVPNEYFEVLSNDLQNHPDVDIFAPIIRGQDGVIYSPNNYRFIKNDLVRNPVNEVQQDRFNAISSCMAIRKRVFDDFRYNEKLFVDEIDHCFCRIQREKGRKFKVLNIEISQNFHQRNNNISSETAWNRVRIRVIDIFRHARLIGKEKLIFQAFIKCCGIGLQTGKKSKSAFVSIKIIGLSFKMLLESENNRKNE